MPGPTEHKSVQARILKYAQEIGWTNVPRDEAERRAALIRRVQRRRSGRAIGRDSSVICGTSPWRRSFESMTLICRN